MNYCQIAPPANLEDYIRYIWTWNSNGVAQNFKIMADGCPGLVYQQSNENSFFQNEKQVPNFFVYGQATKYADFSFSGSKTIGICFHPNALKSIFGIDAHELTDTCMDLDGFLCDDGTSLKEQLLNTAAVDDQIALILSFLDCQVQKNISLSDQLMSEAMEMMIRSKGTLPLKKIESSLRLSQRTLERRFKQYIGLPPVMFLRICRFQASLDQLRNKNYQKLSDIAYYNGYADQSHYIRNFKHFSGFSPFKYHHLSNSITNEFPVLTASNAH